MSPSRRITALLATAAAVVSLAACTDDPPETRERASVNPTITHVDGIEVVRFDSANVNEQLPPVVLVHGGGGDWRTWAWHAEQLADTGRVVYAFSWRHHGGSDRLDQATFTGRSILDVARDEIPTVVRHALDRGVGGNVWHDKVDLVGRSMGGAAALGFAATNPDAVRRLAVLEPVVPAAFAPAVIPIDVTPFEPSTPGDEAGQRELFYPTLPPDQAAAAYYASNLESPLAIWEATRWTLDINVDDIRATRVLAVASDPALDRITPASSIRAMAEHMGAEFEQRDGVGHSEIMMVEPHRSWLRDRLVGFLAGG